MHIYIILASVLFPLIGVFQMENGAYGNSVGMVGYQNGVTLAYAAYSLIVVATFFLAYGRTGKLRLPVGDGEALRFRAFAISAFFLVLLPSLLIMLFVFSGWHVWSGQIAKGQFRANLGPLGSLAYMVINAFVPLCMAYASILYRRAQFNWINLCALAILFACTIIVGSTWGFKSTGITMLIPALLILFWDAAIGRIAAAACALSLVIVGFFLLFDNATTEAAEGMGFLWTRLTTLQGDVAWELWNQYRYGIQFPSYAQTWLALAGGNVLTMMTGVTRDMPDAWASFNFDILLSRQIGLPLTIIEEGHSIVGTPFADGLIMGGITGVIVMAAFSGLLSGAICRLLAWSLSTSNGYLCAFLATYFGIYVVTFLRNGAAIQLFHLSNLVGLGAAVALCIVVDNLGALISRRWKPTCSSLGAGSLIGGRHD